ncbi:MAG TPA: hypothetical protein VGS01_04810 [Candidatus Limnocylindria bacterium]|nr:hypothetical protein [Candidatus Limnocylindria bacterium]
MAHEWSLDVAIAPEGALQRIAAAINRPKKRAFGIFKITNEYVGFIRGDTFEIWERQQRAVHARGAVRGRRGGSRIELHLAMPGRTRVLIATFFLLYVVAAAGLAFRDEGPLNAVEHLVIAVGGGLAIAAIFRLATTRQRTDLRVFVDGLFRDLPRI